MKTFVQIVSVILPFSSVAILNKMQRNKFLGYKKIGISMSNAYILKQKERIPLTIASSNGAEQFANIGHKDNERIIDRLFRAIKKTKYDVARSIASTTLTELDAIHEEGRTVLHLTCAYNRADLVELLLKQGPNINLQDEEGQTPLFLACCNGYEEVPKMLLEAGADANIPDEDGMTPLLETCKNRCFNLAKLLVTSTPSINVDATNKEGMAPLHLISNRYREIYTDGKELNLVSKISLMDLLLSRGANINLQDERGRTPLMIACSNGYEEVPKMLLEAGADANIPDKDGMTPLLETCKLFHFNAAKLLVTSSPSIYVDAMEKDGMTALHLLSSRYREDSKIFFGAPDLLDENCANKISMANLLLSRGANINLQNRGGRTPLMVACYEGFEKMAMQLLEAGADVNISDIAHKTGLHLVSQHFHVNMINWLLKQNAGVNIQDVNGQTPLMFACQYEHEKFVEKLLEAGADVKKTDKSGKTAFMIASENKDTKMIKFILETYGEDYLMEQDYLIILRKACELGRYGTVSAMIDSYPSLIKAVDSRLGQTVLHVACLYNKASTVKSLLEKQGVNINQKDKNGRTAFSIACDQGYKDIMKLLLDAGVDMRSI